MKLKAAIIAVVLTLILALCLSSCGGSSSETAESDTPDSNVNSDMEIVTRDGHPTLYGSVEQAHEIWKDVSKGKIVFPDKNDSYSDKTIVYLDAYRDEDMIRTVDIYFSNFEEEEDVTLDDALKISASYMPFDIIDKYYECDGSKLYVSDDGDKANYYVISYGLTDSAGDAYYAGEHQYSGSIDVIFKVQNDIVQNFSIRFGTEKWMNYPEKNSYHTEEWEYDLLSLK